MQHLASAVQLTPMKKSPRRALPQGPAVAKTVPRKSLAANALVQLSMTRAQGQHSKDEREVKVHKLM
jgi:hypothetical protein